MRARGIAAGCVVLLALACWGIAQAGVVRPMVGTDTTYVFQSSDDLSDVAHHYGLALEHLAFANDFPATNEEPDVPAGTRLVIPERRILPASPPSDGLVLNIPERGIFYFHHGRFQKFYPVAVGRVGFETPVGQWRVIEKVVNPTWCPPAWANLGNKPWLPGPKNPLGDRWIGLSAHGVGIHGTTCPLAIGMACSHGCIRMYPDLEHELFTEAFVGMPVRIEYEPVKLGRDPNTGDLCMAVYPDIYNRVPLLETARRLAQQAGLHVPEARLERIVDLHEGRPVSLTHDTVMVKINQRRLGLLQQPVVQNGTVYVPAAVVEAAGVSLGNQPPVEIHGHPMYSAQSVFGSQCVWDPETLTLQVSRPTAASGE
ncbi:MAG: L,D-transpeptidase [Candidatus Xenobia bacterium]